MTTTFATRLPRVHAGPWAGTGPSPRARPRASRRSRDEALAYLAVHLNDDFLRLVCAESIVVGRPGLPHEALRVARALPELLGEMGRVGREHEDEGLPERARYPLEPSELVHVYHHGGDGGVEIQSRGIVVSVFSLALSPFLFRRLRAILAEGSASARSGRSERAQTFSRKRLTPIKPAVAQGLDTSSGPMNIS